MRMIYFVLISMLLIAVVTTPAAAATTWYVHDGDDLQSIINGASSGDTVFVWNGSYTDPDGVISVRIPNLTLKGEGADVVTLTMSNMVAVGDADADASGCVIEGFKFANCEKGLNVMPTSPNCIIRNCVFEGLTGTSGVQLFAENTTFENNVISNATTEYDAVSIGASVSNSKIINNIIRDHQTTYGDEIGLYGPSNCIVADNTFINSAGGIYIYAGSENIITRNNINSSWGFYFWDGGPHYKIFLNNIVHDGVSVTYDGTPPATIYWNSTSQINYTYNGTTYTNYLGNYWDDYTNGDADGNGIGDTPYNIPGSATDMDHQPLMEKFENYLGEATPPAPAPQPDWHQFQKEEVNSGKTNESAPVNNAAKAWKQFTHTDSWRMAGIDVAPIVADDKVFVIDAQAYAWAFDAKTGAEIWNQSLSCEGGQFQLATPAYGAGKVFFATNDGHVYALNATTGVVLWNSKIAETYDQLATPLTYAVADGKVYVGSWKSNNGTSEAGVYYCLDSDGSLVWNRTSTTGKGYYWSGPAVIGDYLVYGDLASVLTSVNRDDGTKVDEINITTDVSFNRSDAGAIKSSVAYSEGFVYFTSEGGYTWRIGFDDSTGEFSATEGWSKKIETSTSTPAVHDGRVYVGTGSWSAAGKLYCLNASDGGEKWSFEPDGGIKASPAISIQGDDLYLYITTNCANSRVYCIDENGNELWNFTTEEAGTAGGYILQGVAISDGYVYFGNDGGYLYGLKEAPVLDWKQFHYDVANTGNSPANAPDTNQTKWITDNIGAVASSQAMIVGDKVFVYGNDHVLALNKSLGVILWNTSIPGDTQGWGSWASPAYDGDRLFVSAGYNLTKLNATTGAKIQEIAFPDGGYSCNGGPTVADGMVFAGSGGSNYYAFDVSDLNTVVWSYAVAAGSANSVPAVADDKVVFGELTWSGASDLYCVAESTGDWIWNTTLVGAVGGSAAIDAANNRVYVATFVDYGSNTGKLFALALDTGVIQWSADITYTDSTPAIADSYIYVSGGVYAPGATYCFDSAGVEQWNVSCGSWTVSTAVTDGKVFTGKVGILGAAGLAAVDAITGDPVWSYADAGSSPSVSDSMLVSIGSDGKVYAFEEGEVLQFDTGAPDNPYPSIPGVYNGTITPNKDILVNRIYTYPCTGTGGHTEYAKIWNETTGKCVVAEWNGYVGDYHNTPFNTTLTLREGVVYNYTIRTGSYPQIIHKQIANVTGGTITCDEFIDANGRVYHDWIPAIKLFYE